MFTELVCKQKTKTRLEYEILVCHSPAQRKFIHIFLGLLKKIEVPNLLTEQLVFSLFVSSINKGKFTTVN